MWYGKGLTPRPGRATLYTPPATAAFANASTVTAVLNVSNINCHGRLQPNILMSAIVQSLDIVIGDNNYNAAGLRLRGAQGTSAEDVFINAGADVYAGLVGVSGSGW